MLLLRLTDAAEDADEYARGPRGLLDFDWFGTHGGRGRPPAARQSGLTSGLMMPPTGPEDPLWSVARYGVPQPPFGRMGPVLGLPSPTRSLPSAYPAVPGLGIPGSSFPVDAYEVRASESLAASQPLPPGPGTVDGSAPARPPVMRGLASLLLEDDSEDSAAHAMRGTNDAEAPAQVQGTYGDPNLILAQASGTQSRPGLDYSLDAIERNFRAIVPGWRKQNLPQAATNLEWFLDGRGDTRIIDRDEARQMEPIRSAEELNSSRTENAFTDPKWVHAKKLRDLKDGESVTIRDHWDRDYKDDSFVRQLLSPSTRDFALAFGNTQFHTDSDFDVSRSGDELFIEGTVLHSWKDRYEFHPDRYFGMGGALAKGAAALEEHRGARPFDIESTWRRRIKGKVRIKGRDLVDPVFTWEDIEE